jgi:Beta galactosidase small chain
MPRQACCAGAGGCMLQYRPVRSACGPISFCCALVLIACVSQACSQSRGALVSCSWAVAGQELLAEPVLPCFVRAPTDNDVGGSGGTSHAARWLQAGLDRLAVVSAKMQLQESCSTRVTVQVRAILCCEGTAVWALLCGTRVQTRCRQWLRHRRSSI